MVNRKGGLGLIETAFLAFFPVVAIGQIFPLIACEINKKINPYTYFVSSLNTSSK